MHDAARWKSVVARMVWRMEGQGNLGKLMQDLMADVKVPSANEQDTLLRYLQKHAQRELNRGRYSDLNTDSGRRYSIACAQCHVLPDPRRHTASEWPAVVERMRRNMAWANRVTGTRYCAPNPSSTPPTSRAICSATPARAEAVFCRPSPPALSFRAAPRAAPRCASIPALHCGKSASSVLCHSWRATHG